MTDEELEKACADVGNAVVDLYANRCGRSPKAIVITGMTGGLAACAAEAGITRSAVLAALNSAFDDIELGEATA